MMEPSLLKKSDKNINIQKKYLVIAVFLMVTLFMGSSYSLLTNFDNNGWEVISFKDNDLNLTLSSSNPVLLKGSMPMSEEEGLKGDAITLTFTNTDALLGNSKNLNIKKYEIKLINKENAKSTLDYSYIKYAISFNNVKYNIIGNLKDSNNIIYTGYNLEAGKSKTIYLKVWVDQDKVSDTNDIVQKEFVGAIDVALYQEAMIPASEELITNEENNGLVPVNMLGQIYNNGDYLREYRYSGGNINNYIIFNDENYRIIGLFDDDGDGKYNIKIVKDTPIEEAPPTYTNSLNETYNIEESVENIGNASVSKMYWNNSVNGTTTYNDWSTSGLMYYLNDENSLNHNSYYDTIEAKYKKFITEATYYLGSVDLDATVSKVYADERGIDNKNNKKSWVGKVGLLYPSDYGYATSSSLWWETKLSDYKEVENIRKVNWMLASLNSGWNWFISPSFNDSNTVIDWSNSGVVNSNGNVTSHSNGVRPVLNLKSDVVFVGDGDGSLNNPYRIVE
ncbi:MAG: hypothetical protein IJ068_07780 [Bacilli bacterium]|nr:hypothetical protein [Bacilli bacterium]